MRPREAGILEAAALSSRKRVRWRPRAPAAGTCTGPDSDRASRTARGLLLAGGDHPDLARTLDDRQRQRDTGGRRLRRAVHRHRRARVVQRGHAGEQRGHVAVRAHAQHQDVEGRRGAVVLRPRGPAELLGVRLGRLLRGHAAESGPRITWTRAGSTSTLSRRALRAPVSLRSESPLGRKRSSPHQMSRLRQSTASRAGEAADLGQGGDADGAAGQNQRGRPLGRLVVDQRVITRAATALASTSASRWMITVGTLTTVLFRRTESQVQKDGSVDAR